MEMLRCTERDLKKAIFEMELYTNDKCGSFTEQLISAIMKADHINIRKLAMVYPDIVCAVEGYRGNDTRYIKIVDDLGNPIIHTFKHEIETARHSLHRYANGEPSYYSARVIEEVLNATERCNKVLAMSFPALVYAVMEGKQQDTSFIKVF